MTRHRTFFAPPPRWGWSLSAPLVLAALAGSPAPVAAQGNTGALLIADALARPVEDAGTIFIQPLFGAASAIFTNEEPLVVPYALHVIPGTVYALDRFASDPGGSGTGALFGLDPVARVVSSAVYDDRFTRVADLDVLPDGRVLIVDEDAGSDAETDTGTIFAVNPSTGVVDIWSDAPEFVDPVGVLVDSLGAVYVIDKAADPSGFGLENGAVFELDPTTGAVDRVVGASEDFKSPIDAVRVGSFLYVVDRDALSPNGQLESGDFFRVHIETGAVERFLTLFRRFEGLSDVEVVEGTLYLVDRDGPTGTSEERGTVYRVDVGSRRAATFAQDDAWRDPTSIAFFPNAGVIFADHDLDDLNGDALEVGDRVRLRVDIENVVGQTVGFAAIDSVSSYLDVDPSTIVVSVGEVVVTDTDSTGVVLDWTGDIPGAVLGHYEYEAVVLPTDLVQDDIVSSIALADDSGGFNISRQTWSTRRALIDDEVVIALQNSFFQPGAIIVAGSDGGDFEVLVDVDGPFLNPTAVELDGRGGVVICDRDADTDSTGTFRGAVFLYDALRDSISVLSAALEFVDPIDVVILPNENLAVLDVTTARIYEIDQNTGSIVSELSDPRFVAPSDLVATVEGDLLVVDRDANPFSFNTESTGAVFRVSPSGVVTVDSASERYVDPVGIALVTSNEYFVSDWTANPNNYGGNVGTVFRGRTGLEPVVYVTGPVFENPGRMNVSRVGDLLVSDNSQNVILSIDPTTRDVETFIMGDELISPGGIAVSPVPLFVESRYDVTDLNGGRVVAGDRLRFTIVLINSGNVSADPVSVAGSVPEELDFQPGTLSSTSGPPPVYDPVLREIQWSDEIGVGQTVELGYTVEVDPLTETGRDITSSVLIDTPLAVEPFGFQNVVRVLGAFLAGDLLLMDFGYQGEDGSRGAIYRRNLVEGGTDLVITEETWRWPRSIATDSQRRMVLVDQLATPSGQTGMRGAIYRYDGADDRLDVVSERPEYVSLVDVLITADRTFILDRDADPDARGAFPGAIFEVDLDTNTIVSSYSGDGWVNPVSLALDTDGTLLVLDQDANPLDSEGRGTLFRVDYDGRTSVPIAASDDWALTTDVIVNSDGTYIVCDAAADPLQFGIDTGAVFGIDPITLEVSVKSAAASYRSPFGLAVGPQDELLVVDQGSSALASVVWRIVEPTGNPAAYWTHSEFEAGRALAVLERPFLDRSSFSVSDRNGFPVESSDVLDYRFTLRNSGDSAADRVTGTIDVSDLGTVDPASVSITAGSISVFGNELVLDSTVGARDSTIVLFTLALTDDLAPGAVMLSVANLSAGNGVSVAIEDVQRTPVTFLPNDFIVLDQIVSAEEFSAGLGALLRWDGASRTAAPYAALSSFRWLQSIRLDPADRSIMHVVDQRADPFGFGRSPGAVFEMSVPDGRLLDAYSSRLFVSPTAAFVDGAGDLIVVDTDADPNGIGAPVGALFHVDRTSGAISTIASHPLFVEPRDGALLPDGTFLLVDRDADPNDLGGDVGTIFQVDPATGGVSVLTSGGFLVDPISVTPYTGPSFLVVDITADPLEFGGTTGTVFQYVPGSTVDPLIASPTLRRPRSAKVGAQNEVYIVDTGVDPNGIEPGSGAILRYHPSDGNVVVYAFSENFRTPLSLAFVDSPTPVEAIFIDAVSRPDGSIEVSWEAIVTGRVARFDVLRSPVIGDVTFDAGEVVLTPDGVDPDGRSFLDTETTRGETYSYRVRLTETNGDDTISGSVRATSLEPAPPAFRLVGGRPNPFRGSATVTYEVPAPGGPVTLHVFDVAGRRVATLARGEAAPGRHVVVWDGVDGNGFRVAPGVYFYRMIAPGYSATQRLIRVR